MYVWDPETEKQMQMFFFSSLTLINLSSGLQTEKHVGEYVMRATETVHYHAAH